MQNIANALTLALLHRSTINTKLLYENELYIFSIDTMLAEMRLTSDRIIGCPLLKRVKFTLLKESESLPRVII